MSTTASHDHAHAAHAHDAHYPGFVRRWLMSTNHKDIGTLYITWAIIAGIEGGVLSEIMRMQLMHPNNTLITSGQTWNAIVTAHGLLMIFFMV
ncbi:cytochrome c oxidase subunit I, partial [Acidiphilium sp. AL]|uniref:cbb3-type cytochrome c oxidase subunit I n=1 Tax=Acidiphilium sp. AL TaxID=2871704 RepID=UPI0038D0C18C|nr:cytochrome c oxidase subunit I [Acidiphilium sp. AL]